MSRSRWLPALVRARQAREDVAKAETARAVSAEIESLRAAVAARERLDGADPLPVDHVRAFAAAAAARAASAQLLSVAVTAWRADTARTADAREVLVDHARSRRSVERLVERRHALEQAARLRAEQAVLDEIGARPRGPRPR